MRNSVMLSPSGLDTAISSTPSPLTSPIAARLGILPVANGEPAIRENPPAPNPSKSVNPTLPLRADDLLGQLTMARSSLPPPLTSPIAKLKGESLQRQGDPADGLNPPLPSPSRTVTSSPSRFVVMMSTLPSPF